MSEERTEDLLASAAMWGDLTLLESLLENGADPNLPNTQGNPPLHVASYYGEIECASVLLSYKGESGGGGQAVVTLGKLFYHRDRPPTCRFPSSGFMRQSLLFRLLRYSDAGKSLDEA